MRAAWIAVLATGILLAGAARADIYEWVDASGAHHYTNDKRGVPSAEQATAAVRVVEWWGGRPRGRGGARGGRPPAPPAPRRTGARRRPGGLRRAALERRVRGRVARGSAVQRRWRRPTDQRPARRGLDPDVR